MCIVEDIGRSTPKNRNTLVNFMVVTHSKFARL